MNKLWRDSRWSPRARLWMLALVTVVAATLSAVAWADNVQNDVTTGGTDTFTAGGSTPVGYRIAQNNGDGETGCNAKPTSPATVTINVPAAVTVDTNPAPGNQNTLSFTACGVFLNATFSSATAGNYPITVSVADSGVGTYNVNPAAFTLHVLATPPPSNTPPTVSVTGVTGGASYNKGSVPAATCHVEDAEDGPGDFAATLGPVSGPYAADGIGDQTASCSYTDSGGLTDTDSATYHVVDPTAPVVGVDVDGTLGDNDWFTSDVTVTFTVIDPESTPSTSADCDGVVLDSDTAGVTLTCTAASAGGVTVESVTIKRDATKPLIVLDASADVCSVPGDNGWCRGEQTAGFKASDATSGLANGESSPWAFTKSTSDNGSAVMISSGTQKDAAGNESSAVEAGPYKIDSVEPSISGDASPDPNANGWNNTNVDVTFTCGDAGGSGVASCGPDATLTDEDTDQSVNGEAKDEAGNTASTSVGGIDIDKTAPAVTWNSLINDGDSFNFGSVPAAPSCTATDGLSGLDPNGCTVSGYSTLVGSHTLNATAKDNADNETVKTRSYTVLAWTLKGFYQPVDMNGVVNTVKNGSTVPLKFEIFAGATELTNTANVKSLAAPQIACDNSSVIDEIEITATGGTSLRYDATGGQFIYNWQTPKKPGTCYRVTMTTQDASTLVALFKLK